MPKSKTKSDANQDLVLMRMSIDVVRERINQDLNALAARLDQLLPEIDEARYQREKNTDWKEKVKGW